MGEAQYLAQQSGYARAATTTTFTIDEDVTFSFTGRMTDGSEFGPPNPPQFFGLGIGEIFATLSGINGTISTGSATGTSLGVELPATGTVGLNSGTLAAGTYSFTYYSEMRNGFASAQWEWDLFLQAPTVPPPIMVATACQMLARL